MKVLSPPFRNEVLLKLSANLQLATFHDASPVARIQWGICSLGKLHLGILKHGVKCICNAIDTYGVSDLYLQKSRFYLNKHQ